MNESGLKTRQKLACVAAMPHCKFWRHNDRVNGGYPDVSLAWHMVCSWWEFKHYDEQMFKLPPQQVVTCQQLAEQALCYYVVFEEKRCIRRTYIVEPKRIAEWRHAPLVMPGFDFMWVAAFMRRSHLGMYENQSQER